MANNQLPNIDFAKLMQSAQQIAQNISEDDKNNMNNMNMEQMFDQVTNTVFSSLDPNGDKIDSASKAQMKLMSKTMLGQVMESVEEGMDDGAPIPDSKIDLGDFQKGQGGGQKIPQEGHKLPQKDSKFEEVSTDDEEEIPDLRPRMKDLFYSLSLNLDELYTGKTKKIAVKRNRLDKKGKKVVKDKRKLEIPIIPGMRDGQEIRFNKEGDEKPGYETGDIVITLDQNGHNNFERHGNTLYTVKNISLYESYAAARGEISIVIKHLNGSYMVLKTNGEPLHTRDGARKVRNGGMPVYKSKKSEYGDLYIRFNVILPEKIEDDAAMAAIEQLFPVLQNNKDDTVFHNKTNIGFDISGRKVHEVLLEEVTEEDMEQLDYEEESDSDEYSDSDESSDSDEYDE